VNGGRSNIVAVNRVPVKRKIRRRSFRTSLKSQRAERKIFSTKNNRR